MGSPATSLVIIPPWRDLLIREIKAAEREVLIASPYIKTTIARAVSLAPKISDVKIKTVTRFKSADFAYGASDIEALWTLYQRNGRSHAVRYDNILHAKLYIIDRKTAYVGSSNLTYSGLERNREICLKCTDPILVDRLCAQFDAIWDGARILEPEDFGRMLLELQSPDRAVAALPEDQFEISAGLPEAGAEVGEDTHVLFDGDEQQPHGVFDTRADELAELAQALADDALPGDGREIEEERMVDRIDQFLGILSRRLGVPVEAAPALFAAVVFERSAKDSRPSDRETAHGVALNWVCSHWGEQLASMGRGIYEYACVSIALRAGVGERFGVSAVTQFAHECLARKLVSRQWTTNFLGPLVRHRSVAEASRGAIEVAAYRLLGASLAVTGPSWTTAFIERHFNPLDELGVDIASLLALRDPKTSVQEVAMVQGLEPRYFDHQSTGPDHDLVWTCRVVVGKLSADGRGGSKSLSEFAAASAALDEMARRPGWQKAVVEWRKALIDRYRRDAPVPSGGWKLSPEKSSAMARALSERGIDIPPTQGFLALLGPEARYKAGGRDNRLLSHLGAVFTQVAYRLLAYRLAPDAEVSPQQRGFFQQLPEQLKIQQLLDDLDLPRMNGSKPEMAVAQALIGALIVAKGEDGAIADLEPTLASIVKALPDADAPGRRSIENILSSIDDVYDPRISFTTLLQEVTQGAFKILPTYQISRAGLDHKPIFTATVSVDGLEGRGDGETKGVARNAAAHALLVRFRERGLPPA